VADLIPPGWAQVTVPLQHAESTRVAAVVFGVEVGGQPDADLLAVAVQSRFQTSLGPRFDSQVLIGPARTVVGQDGAEPTQGATDFTGGGGASGSTPPSNVAVLARKRTARGGRRGAGRMFLPWWMREDEANDTGRLTTAAITAGNTALANFLSGLQADGTDMVVLHSVGQTTPGNPNVVTSLTVDPVVATQRRRLGRR